MSAGRSAASATETDPETTVLPGPTDGSSTAALPEGGQAAPGRASHSSRSRRPSAERYHLDRLGWIGVALLLLQGIAMCAWSTLLWHRFALTNDYSAYHQAWWLIAHGDFDPRSTLLHLPFWQNNFELMMWPLALIGVIWSHGPVLLWVQDICLVGAEIVAWRWISEIASTTPRLPRYFFSVASMVLLLANPWSWWSISFDFHMELVAVPFVVLAIYEFAHERPRAWIWVVVVLLCGNAEASWVIGIGVAALLAGRRYWRSAPILIGLGTAWLLFSTSIHGDRGGNVIGAYGYLASGQSLSIPPSVSKLVLEVLSHPGRVGSVLWRRRVDLWANLAPGGVLGLANPWVLGPALVVLLGSELASGSIFAAPLFQSALLYVITPLGTALVLLAIYRRWPRLSYLLGVIVAVNALAWSVLWAPYIPTTWLRVSGPSAALFARADSLIPASAEVVASQGIAGRFSDRRLLFAIMSPSEVIPLRDRDTWWIVAPSVGTETDPLLAADALVAELAGPLHAALVLHGGGVWVFHWTAPPTLHSITVPVVPSRVEGWLFPGVAGLRVLAGSSLNWHLLSTGRAGYVLARDYWRLPPGYYEVSVTLSSTIPVRVEVWNATGDVLLAQRILPATDGVETVSIPVNAERLYPHHVFRGVGPFEAGFPGAPHDDQLEPVVWSPGGGVVDVEQIEIGRMAAR